MAAWIASRRVLHGPSGRGVTIELDEEWLGIDAGAPVPLYVGKTTSGMRARLAAHLMFGTATSTPQTDSTWKTSQWANSAPR